MGRDQGLIGLCALLAALASLMASAAETRFEIDPTVDMTTLMAAANPSNMPAQVTRTGSLFQLDASAVLHGCDLQTLYTDAYDFNDYVADGMPDLKQSVVVETTFGSTGPSAAADTIFVWTDMNAFSIESQSYMEVHVDPTLTLPNSRGIDWDGVPGSPGRPGWTYPDKPGFTDFYGSWYMQDMGGGDVYVRYFLSAQPSTAVPGFILNAVVPGHLKSSARQTVQILWQKCKIAFASAQ